MNTGPRYDHNRDDDPKSFELLLLTLFLISASLLLGVGIQEMGLMNLIL